MSEDRSLAWPLFNGWEKGSSNVSDQKELQCNNNNDKVADWLYTCEKTLDFFFNNQPDDITEEEVAKAEQEQVYTC